MPCVKGCSSAGITNLAELDCITAGPGMEGPSEILSTLKRSAIAGNSEALEDAPGVSRIIAAPTFRQCCARESESVIELG